MNNPGNDNGNADWQREKSFVKVVEALRDHHLQLWFRPGVGVPVPSEHRINAWVGSEILSSEGRILAKQVGNANQWHLSACYSTADRYPIADDELEECQELTQAFFCTVAGHMLLANMYSS